MKKITGLILCLVLFLPSMSCGLGPWMHPDPEFWDGSHGYGSGYPREYSHRHPKRDHEEDNDAAVLGAVLGTAAVIGTVLVVDAIRNPPPTQ